MSENSIISLQNVNKWFGDFHVLQDVNLEVQKKERIVVCGPSGSGKSTMIRCINRLEEHQEGTIIVPSWCSSSRLIHLIIVDFPDPEGPQTTIRSFFLTSKLTSCKT